MSTQFDNVAIQASLGFLQVNQQQIHENIKFADQKAGAVLGFNAALLGGIYTIKVPPQSLYALGFVGLVLAVGILLAFCVIWPRGGHNAARGAGVIDAIRIARLTDAEYKEKLNATTATALVVEMEEFVFDRARIDITKYRLLRCSLAVSAGGWSLAFIYAGWTRYLSACV